ncbi:MAG: hypothetical protein JXB15_16320 [Anaerolineales bacterium]|nr:hypothetical protein [Anaerolineales bacterium]
MSLTPLRWLARNLSTLLLAFILAVVVWVSAVLTADPNEEAVYRSVPIERIGQDSNMLLVGDIPDEVELTLRAPRSIWAKINNDPNLVHAWVDLTGLEAGEHMLKVKTRIDASPIRYVQVNPSEIRLVLEPLVALDFPVQLSVSGQLPLGYQKGDPTTEPITVTVSGPASAVNKVAQVRASININGATDFVRRVTSIDAVDENGNQVSNVLLVPKTVTVIQPVSLLGGFKNVVVKVVTKGQVANGYRLTNISVAPPTVTLFSDDPELLDGVPGYVDTMPVDLNNLTDDIEINVGLNLPEGVTLVRDPSVLVQVSVAAIEGSLTLTLPVEVTGLAPEFQALISPATVDVIVAGPLNILEQLTPASFRVVLDLSGLPTGVYQRSPVVDLLPDLVRIQTTLPETVEVLIELAPTPTPAPTTSATSSAPQEPTPVITPTP